MESRAESLAVLIASCISLSLPDLRRKMSCVLAPRVSFGAAGATAAAVNTDADDAATEDTKPAAAEEDEEDEAGAARHTPASLRRWWLLRLPWRSVKGGALPKGVSVTSQGERCSLCARGGSGRGAPAEGDGTSTIGGGCGMIGEDGEDKMSAPVEEDARAAAAAATAVEAAVGATIASPPLWSSCR